MFSEIIPSEYRGKGMVCVNFFVTVGKLYGFFIAYLTLDSYTSGDWRLMIRLNTIPGILVFIGTFFWVEESARFRFARGEV
jgi:putative MFS transporter